LALGIGDLKSFSGMGLAVVIELGSDIGIKKCNTWPAVLCVCAVTIILCPAKKVNEPSYFLTSQ
jgi:hypothetical protein